MNELIAREQAILASIIGMTLICSIVALATGAGYWLCFGRRKKSTPFDYTSVNDTRCREYIEPRPAPTEELVIHMCIGPCLSESDIAEIEAEQVQKEEMESWSL